LVSQQKESEMREKIAKFVTVSMLGWMSLVVVAILMAIALNYFGVVNLSAAYLGF
jgi:hypothetical protein